MSSGCPFCPPDQTRIVFQTDLFFGVWDGYPVSPGHILIIPRRHIPTWFEATPAEQVAVLSAVEQARQEILRRYQPDGFNIGINVGSAAGQTVFHLHVHVIPRYTGDLPDPRGGVRNVIPAKGNYLRTSDRLPQLVGSTPHDAAIIRGENDPLLPHLLAHLDRAVRADLCVAFVQLSGLRLIQEHLRDLLNRGGIIRILTGDYLDITDPRALMELLDLEGNIQLRVFEARNVSFHPKSYLFRFSDGTSAALVGSSNLSGSALQTGIEWNYRVVTVVDAKGLSAVQDAFDSLFFHPSTQPITRDWALNYSRRRIVSSRPDSETQPEPPEPPPLPHAIQLEALKALRETRAAGNSAGLVVLATGLGKTWLSAFDCNQPGFERVLFVAHREEILAQAIKTFRRIRPDASFGHYTGTEKNPTAEVLFASIQTLGRQSHLRQFARERFDYIIVDEFHHASAATYRNLLAYFAPKFLLGLTATPERTDGGDLLGLCQENLVYRCDVARGITERQLVPFHYFGVPDEVDYQNIPWRNSRFDEEELTRAVATQKRAQNALEQHRARGGKRTLAFCCSQRHSDFMADFFCQNGLRAVAVHSGSNSAPRSASLESLRDGLIDIIFAVDMFNEGVDLPNVDTVMMLRPTESPVIWLQQFGRGLRKSDGKSHLTVIDYIGNHRIFLTKPRILFNLAVGDQFIERALNLLLAGEFSLPPGCEVTYELQAVDILRSLLRGTADTGAALRAFYLDYRERHGQRPTASEVFREGYSPKSVRTSHGSWFSFVSEMGDMSPQHQEILAQARDFFNALEITPMTKSFKMVTLLAMLNEDAFPGSIGVNELANAFAHIVERSAILRNDVGSALDERVALIRLLETNPIAAWVGGRGTRDQSYFAYQQDRFAARIEVPAVLRPALQELVRELTEWRLAEYLSRTDMAEPNSTSFTCKVSHSGGNPILFLPDRVTHPAIPSGWAKVSIGGTQYLANFVKIAVNVVKEQEKNENVLSSLLRGWFGPDAGRPGTNFSVTFEPTSEGFEMRPTNRAVSSSTGKGAEVWRHYSREEIPDLFGLQFSTAIWNAGFVPAPPHLFLLVTLDKDDLAENHKYEDKFLSPELFQWQSQNRTKQDSKHGQMISHHRESGISIHLFIRRSKKTSGRPTPFTYCGPVVFETWEGEKPITVRWRLQAPVPERLRELFRIGSNT